MKSSIQMCCLEPGQPIIVDLDSRLYSGVSYELAVLMDSVYQQYGNVFVPNLLESLAGPSAPWEGVVSTACELCELEISAFLIDSSQWLASQAALQEVIAVAGGLATHSAVSFLMPEQMLAAIADVLSGMPRCEAYRRLGACILDVVASRVKATVQNDRQRLLSTIATAKEGNPDAIDLLYKEYAVIVDSVMAEVGLGSGSEDLSIAELARKSVARAAQTFDPDRAGWELHLTETVTRTYSITEEGTTPEGFLHDGGRKTGEV